MTLPPINKRFLLYIFVSAFVIRYGWATLSDIDNFSGNDWARYDSQSDEILRGNLDLETYLFITAPLFSYTVALFKLLFGQHYVPFLEFFQITLSSISAVFLALTANELFRSHKVALLTGLSFALYPATLYWTHLFSQDSLFQSLLITGLYFFTKFIRTRESQTVLAASIFLTLALLTKSHIQLAFPFLILAIILTDDKIRGSYKPIMIMIGTIALLTMPYGIYNKVENGTYVIASSGGGGIFLTGHNEDAYTDIVNPPTRGSEEWRRLQRMDLEVYRQLEPKIEGLSHSQKQSLYFKTGLEWTISNPFKSVTLALVNLKLFLQPGFHRGHHAPNMWLITFLLSLPVFILAYFEIIRSVINNWKMHTQIVSLFIAMAAFSIIFYSQNRFRVITIEPWYLMYACSGFLYFHQKLKRKTLFEK